MRLRLRAIPASRTVHRKVSHTISGQGKHRYDISTVDTWNEVRKIGAEGKQIKCSENVFKEGGNEVTIQEAQDWDYYIAKFNEQYRRKLKDKTDWDDDSIETLASTKSELMRDRKKRMAIFRGLFILTCLIQCGTAVWGAFSWFMTYEIYPMGFLNEIELSLLSKFFTPGGKWIALVCHIHSLLIAFAGFLCAFCFQRNPAILKQFILRVPYLLLASSFLIFVAVTYIGELDTKHLSYSLDKLIPMYHDFDINSRIEDHAVTDDLNNATSAKRLWDKLQNRLQCCGTRGPHDWESLEVGSEDEHFSLLPSSCCPKAYARTAWNNEKKERPADGDCKKKVNSRHNTTVYEWTYPNGCLNYALPFFQERGATVVSLMAVNFCILCVCLLFGFKYYATSRKVHELKFKYSGREWLMDIFFISQCTCLFVKICGYKKKKRVLSMYPTHPNLDRTSRTSKFLIPRPSSNSASSSSQIVPGVVVTAPTNIDDQPTDTGPTPKPRPSATEVVNEKMNVK